MTQTPVSGPTKPASWYQQAALVPYRWRNGQLELVLITSRKRKRWLIPKGIVEPDLAPADSAAKEGLEEAGVVGQVSRLPFARYTYEKWGGTCQVEVFLCQVSETLPAWPEAEWRDRRWVTHDEALELVELEALGNVLRQVPAVLQAQPDAQRDDFGVVFSNGPVPDRDTLKALPYGQLLQSLFYPLHGDQSPNGDPKGARHLRTVLEKMEVLLSSQPAGIVSDRVEPLCRPALKFFVTSCRQIWYGAGDGRGGSVIFPETDHEQIRTFLRVAALYHDIGKYINTDRHPTSGWYLVSSMYPQERARLRTMLDIAEMRTLLTIIRDHDKFGVLSTGEASMPLLMSITNVLQEEIRAQKQRLTALMLVSLADMSASFPLTSCVAGTVSHDWSRFIEALESAWGDRGRLLDRMVQESQQYENTVERIRRLILEASQDRSGQWAIIDDRELISDVLKTTFRNRLEVFCEDFALIAKLDYSLRFFRLLVQRCRQQGVESPSTIAHIIINILRGIVETYSGMLHSRRGRFQPIGIEFSGLTPPHAPEKAQALIDLLLERPAEGLAWLLSDVPAWYIWD